MRSEQHDAVMAVIAAAADAGLPAPRSYDIEKATGVGETRIQTMLGHLYADGLLAVEYRPDNRNRRRFCVLETGRWTNWSLPRSASAEEPAGTGAKDPDAYMAERMAALGARYEDVRATRFGDGGRASLTRPSTFVASQSSAA